MIQLSQSVGSLDGNLLNVVYNASDLELWVPMPTSRNAPTAAPTSTSS